MSHRDRMPKPHASNRTIIRWWERNIAPYLDEFDLALHLHHLPQVRSFAANAY